MERLLHIACSPRRERSVSRKMAEKFIDTYRLKNPQAPVSTLDLWKMELPEFNEDMFNAKFRTIAREQLSRAEDNSWQEIKVLFNQFALAEKYVFSVPMWNFSIPYKLKHYIDLITQPGMAFEVQPSGYRGLLAGRSAALIMTRGGAYRNKASASLDMQEKYLELWLGFIGITDIRRVYVEPLNSGEERAAVLENALEAVIAEASKF